MRPTLLLVTLSSVLLADDPVYLNNLGSRFFAAGQYRAAEAPLAQAVELWSRKPNEHPTDLEAALHNLAAVYLAEGRFSDAEPLYQRAIELRQARTGEGGLSLLPTLGGLSLLYLEWGKPVRSREVVTRAVAIAAMHKDEQTSEAAQGFASLGGILIAQGRYPDARLWLGRALNVREHLFGADNASVADTLMEVALANRRDHRYEEAGQAYRQALNIYQQTQDTGKSAFAMRCLAEILISRHKYPEAEQTLDQATEALEHVGNPVELGRVHAGLADLRVAQKRFGEAAKLYRQALDLLEPAFGPENPQLLAILDAYARALRAGQDYATAAGVDMRTMKIRVSLTLRGQVSSLSDALVQ
jgi:tetratricopeptide (TPR) repeat protein